MARLSGLEHPYGSLGGFLDARVRLSYCLCTKAILTTRKTSWSECMSCLLAFSLKDEGAEVGLSSLEPHSQRPMRLARRSRGYRALWLRPAKRRSALGTGETHSQRIMF